MNTCLILSTVESWYYLHSQAQLVTIFLTAIAILLFYGSHLQYKKKPLLDGLMNLTLGIALFLFYAYFVLVQPLLGWLGPTGYMMLAPALVSGILGIGIKKFGWHQK